MSYYQWLERTLDDDDEGKELLNMLVDSDVTEECMAELHGLYRH